VEVEKIFIVVRHRYKYTIYPTAIKVPGKSYFICKIFMCKIDEHMIPLFPCYELNAIDGKREKIVSDFGDNYCYGFALMLPKTTRMRIWLIIKFSRECQHLLLCFFANIVTVTKGFRNG
jgi:hypothetical protein